MSPIACDIPGENEMMDMRFTTFHLKYQISRENAKDLPRCNRCYARWILGEYSDSSEPTSSLFPAPLRDITSDNTIRPTDNHLDGKKRRCPEYRRNKNRNYRNNKKARR